MKKPIISVIVPVFNVERYINRCVDSIINQSYSNLEIILVDDGSTDNSPVICDEYAKSDNRIKVIHKKNGGVSSARNIGLETCTGELVSFIDGDDYISLNAFKKCIDLFNMNNIDAVRFGLAEDNGNSISYKEEKYSEGIIPKAKISELFVDYKLNGSVCCFVIRREIVKDLRFLSNIHLRRRLFVLY